ncbi:MAG: MotA/TolQ/ExbB proton channel family protein [Candidatus Hydrogenedentes bacterium]|nr:MotA/TolQ/ExbB proton channel family protein [Candidatus Hydrogenedentota bacterium]
MKSIALVAAGVFWIAVLAAGIPAAAEDATPTAPAATAPSPAAPAPSPAVPAASAEPVKPAALTATPSHERLTLWTMIQQGGSITWILIVMSIGTLALCIHYFMTLTPAREASPAFLRRALAQVRAGDLRGAYQMCEDREELLPNVIRAGLKAASHDRYVIQEAMESEGERGATALWQKISYINNVGVIAPLLGLLGTVVGMIQAFGSIAMDNSQVRQIEVAYGVAKAMITTAAGLLLAIPAMIAYFYFRGRVVKIISQVEAYATEMIEALTREPKE